MSSLASEVRRLAIPAIAHSLLQTLVFVVDRVMLGRHGEASLAAMHLAGTLEWSIWSVFSAFEVATIARVGRHVGARAPAEARRVAWLSLGVSAALGAALTLLTPVVLLSLPRLAPEASGAVLSEARAYLGVAIAASPLVFVATTGIAILQAGGDTRTPLGIGVLANLVHVALNFVLIPRLGAQGAAISTCVTFGLEAVLALVALASPGRPVSLRGPRAADSARPEARTLLRLGLPALAERVLFHIGYVGYILLIARFGDVAMAANQSLISVESICFLSGEGFGIAAAALVAQKLGAGQPEEARRAMWIAARYAVVSLTLFGAGAFVLRDVVLPMFTDDPAVVREGRGAMPLVVVAQPFMAATIVLAQSLRGAGRAREALVVSLVGAVLVRLTSTYAFGVALGLGLAGAWLGSTVDWAARTVLLVVLHRRGRRADVQTPAPGREEPSATLGA